MQQSGSGCRESAVELAIAASASADSPAFQDAIRQLHEQGWEGVAETISDRFVDSLKARVGDDPCVGDIVLLSKALFPLTRRVLGASAYDLEFLIRGYAGASLLLAAIPPEGALVMQLAVLGVLPEVPEIALGSPCWDGTRSSDK